MIPHAHILFEYTIKFPIEMPNLSKFQNNENKLSDSWVVICLLQDLETMQAGLQQPSDGLNPATRCKVEESLVFQTLFQYIPTDIYIYNIYIYTHIHIYIYIYIVQYTVFFLLPDMPIQLSVPPFPVPCRQRVAASKENCFFVA